MYLDWGERCERFWVNKTSFGVGAALTACGSDFTLPWTANQFCKMNVFVLVPENGQ